MNRIAVFDLDGTLVDSVADIQAALDKTMAELGLAGFDRQAVMRMIGDGVRVTVTKALAARGREFDQAALDRFMAHYETAAADQTRPFAGIAEALDALEAAGWRFAVCTNKPAAAARSLLADLGLASRFAALGGGDSFPVRKPDPAHLLATLAAAGGSAETAVMIGDHRNDVQAAAGAGIPCVFAGWGYGTPEMADGVPVAARPQDLAGIIATLGR